MDSQARLLRLIPAMRDELHAIARWWLENVVDTEAGTIAGEVSNDNRRRHGADLGLVYVSRLLWFFSAACRHEPKPEYRDAARLCYHVLTNRFPDRENGGLVWSVDADGRPAEAKKQTYGQSFAIYGLSEYFMAFGDRESLEAARQLVERLEHHMNDQEYGGYLEALSADWQPLDDVRLGATDSNAEKTMNTHVHVLEAYTNFYRARPTAEFAGTLSALVALFLDRFIPPPGDHLARFFTRAWEPVPAARSFGHDIEASWLLCEAAGVLGDGALLERVRQCSIAMANGVLRHGMEPRGGVMHEGGPGQREDRSRVWWVQAEAMVGFLNAWQLTGRSDYLAASLAGWAFIDHYQRDRENGEWRWFSALDEQAEPVYKAGFWKAPYHNGRALMEMIRRAGSR